MTPRDPSDMATDERCEITELPCSMCAHCRGITTRTAGERKREYRERATDPSLRHGETRTAYSYGCRCGPCVDFHNERQREYARINRVVMA